MPEKLFDIQNLPGYYGNFMRWWRPNGEGYTSNLDDAWKVTEEKAREICRCRTSEDIPRDAELMDRLAQRAVSIDSVWADERKKGIRK